MLHPFSTLEKCIRNSRAAVKGKPFSLDLKNAILYLSASEWKQTKKQHPLSWRPVGAAA